MYGRCCWFIILLHSQWLLRHVYTCYGYIPWLGFQWYFRLFCWRGRSIFAPHSRRRFLLWYPQSGCKQITVQMFWIGVWVGWICFVEFGQRLGRHRQQGLLLCLFCQRVIHFMHWEHVLQVLLIAVWSYTATVSRSFWFGGTYYAWSLDVGLEAAWNLSCFSSFILQTLLRDFQVFGDCKFGFWIFCFISNYFTAVFTVF